MNISILNYHNANPRLRVLVNLDNGLTTYKIKSVGKKGVSLVYSKAQYTNDGRMIPCEAVKGTPKKIKIEFNELNEGSIGSGFAAGECNYKDSPILICW